MATSKPSTKLMFRSRAFFQHSRCASTQSIPHHAAYPQRSSLSDPETTPRPSISTSISKVSRVGGRSQKNMPPPLSLMSMTALLRSILINSISCSPVLLPPSLKVMEILAHSNSAILNPDRNPILGAFLKRTFYAQFCAGENAAEVQRTVDGLKKMGFKGVMLGYAKEVVLDEGALAKLESCGGEENEECIRKEILPWKDGTLKTVEITSPGEFVAIKFTGAGSQALYDLSKDVLPSPALDSAITEICDLASSRGVRLLFDAEQQSLQTGIDNWTIHYMRKYNRSGKAVIHNTYQCYLKSAPSTIARHIATAKSEGFTLGAKLVRGAYLGSDPREVICDTIEDTHKQYDGIAESLMRRSYNSVLTPVPGQENQSYPAVNMILAGHNLNSVRKAMATRSEQASEGVERTQMVYAQLQGMADEVSCELLQAAAVADSASKEMAVDVPQAYKYLVWGSTGECMKYLLRRARENKDAVGRTRVGRDEMVTEVLRRIRGAFSVAR